MTRSIGVLQLNAHRAQVAQVELTRHLATQPLTICLLQEPCTYQRRVVHKVPGYRCIGCVSGGLTRHTMAQITTPSVAILTFFLSLSLTNTFGTV